MFPAYDPGTARTSLFKALLDAAAKHGRGKIILEDIERRPISYDRLVLASMILGDKLATFSRPGEAVGVLLPNVIGLNAVLFGLNAYGRVPALLNFTAGSKNLLSALRTGQIATVVTSKRFISTAKLDDVIAALEAAKTTDGGTTRIVYLEDVRREIGLKDKFTGAVRAKMAASVHRRHAGTPDDAGVILFTSGTEGEPKGVVLSNANLVANAMQIFAHAAGMLSAADTVVNPLPMFHSFGLTAGTLMPLLNGMKVVLYPSPLHYKEVPKLVGAVKATVLFGTDTFAQGYGRAGAPGDLESVRYVIVGAERVKPATRAMWARSGATILEGYGATECAPVIACNVPHACKDGSVGPILPGIEMRLEPVPGIDDGGRLLVRGPNVMRGYLLAARPGEIVPPEGGWHDTGDIVALDEAGFITIKGRAKRFAKIGGEMVSLAAVETMIAELWPEASHVVLALADERKGEQLTLLTDKSDAAREILQARAKAEGYPELWTPRRLIVVDQIPVLGTGKVDFQAAIALAAQS